MRDITTKQITLRTAEAIGIIFCKASTIELIKKEMLPKGNLFDVARAAGFIGAKQTPQLLPHCHPVAIDGMDITFDYLDPAVHAELFTPEIAGRTGIVIRGEAKSIGRTGIEMEMLTAVTVAALEIYDMLKPVDTVLEIGNIRLLRKTGGKSDRKKFQEDRPLCAVLVCSDSAARGQRKDQSGVLVKELLEKFNADVKYLQIVPDDKEEIRSTLLTWIKEDIHFIFTSGGTGFGPRDNTVSVVSGLIEKDALGIAEAMRSYGQMRTPLAMMSRAVAGSVAGTLIVTLPGSAKGARESLEAVVPGIFHARKMLGGQGHE